MCSIYVEADPIQYESRTRSVRIDNVVTTIRLENLFWDVLSEMAASEGTTTNQLIGTLFNELYELRGDSPNFTSFLRVCCLRYLFLQQRDDLLRFKAKKDAVPSPTQALRLRH